MKPKSLIPLVAILAVLAGLVIWKNASAPVMTLEEQVGLVTLLPDGISKTDIARLDLFSGGAPDRKVTLKHDEANDRWVIASHFNAVAQMREVDRYLDSIVEMRGEPRATAVAESELEVYNLNDAAAFHVQGYKEGSDDPYFHLLVGKSPAHNSVFIRKAGSSEVFVEKTNLRHRAGVYVDTPQPVPGELDPQVQAPEPGMWLDRTIVKLDHEKMRQIALTMPDKSLVFEHQELPEPQIGQEDDDDDALPPPVTQFEWKVASGGLDVPIKDNGVRMMMQKLAFLETMDVVDPAKKAEWGLDAPAYVAVVTMEDGEELRLEGARPDPNEDAYVMLAGCDDGMVYKLNKVIFEQVFPKGTDIFEIPALGLNRDAVDSIEITQPEGDVRIVKDGENFRVAGPVAALEPQLTTIGTLAQTIAGWRPTDYADAEVQDLGEPTRTVTVTSGDRSRTVKLYGTAGHVAGTYATIDDGEDVFVMSRMDAERVFVKPRDLYVRTLLDIDDLGIAEIQVAAQTGSYTLTRENDDAWTFSDGETPLPADDAAADRLAAQVAVLQAEDILFGRASIEGETDTLVIKMADGAEHVIMSGPEKDGTHEVVISGKNQVFVVAADSRSRLFPPAANVKMLEPPAPEEAAAEDAAVVEAVAISPESFESE